MTPFLLTLCKHSLLAAAVLALAAITKPLWRERYGARSRCALWLALAVFLLLPVDWSAPSAPVRVEPPAERTLLLSAQRGPSVVRTDELPRRQETVLSARRIRARCRPTRRLHSRTHMGLRRTTARKMFRSQGCCSSFGRLA